MIPKSKVIVPIPWMEHIGPFIRLEEQEGELLAEIGDHIVVLPIGLKDTLTPLLGQKIALLATDIPGKRYLVRTIPEDKMQDLCENEQTSNYCEVI